MAVEYPTCTMRGGPLWSGPKWPSLIIGLALATLLAILPACASTPAPMLPAATAQTAPAAAPPGVATTAQQAAPAAPAATAAPAAAPTAPVKIVEYNVTAISDASGAAAECMKQLGVVASLWPAALAGDKPIFIIGFGGADSTVYARDATFPTKGTSVASA